MTGTDENLNPAEGMEDEGTPGATVEELEARAIAAEKQYSEASKEAKYRTEENKVLRDNNHLTTIAKNDRKMAERIAKENWGLSLEDALSQLWESAPAIERKPEDLDAWYTKKKNEEAVNETIKSFESELDEDKREAFRNEFNEIAEGKELTPEKAKKFATLAWKAVTDEDVKEVSKTKKIVGSVSKSGSPAGKESPEKKFVFPRDNGTSDWY